MGEGDSEKKIEEAIAKFDKAQELERRDSVAKNSPALCRAVTETGSLPGRRFPMDQKKAVWLPSRTAQRLSDVTDDRDW